MGKWWGRSSLYANTLVALICVGCSAYFARGSSVFTHPRDIVQERAEADLACRDIRVSDTGGGSYTATGCGSWVSYVCRVDEDNGRICTREGAPRATSDEVESTGSGGRSTYVAELAAVSEAIEACTERALRLEVGIDAGGRVVRFSGGIATADEQDCVEEVLARVTVNSVAGPTTISTSFPPPAAPRRATPSPAPPASADVLGPWVDAHLAERRDAVLACTGTDMIAVRLESSGGPPRWSLQGSLSGSPEEECVASVLGTDAPPGTGTLIRVVR